MSENLDHFRAHTNIDQDFTADFALTPAIVFYGTGWDSTGYYYRAPGNL